MNQMNANLKDADEAGRKLGTLSTAVFVNLLNYFASPKFKNISSFFFLWVSIDAANFHTLVFRGTGCS